ncbi:hypothetical protein [Fumia xinanensis]|uniref:Uncharacterized protein n=1 Tax=Fumia xinanensis TaxID=2763659 RepID=A0A926I2J2_9FIRM|nr:hypothetical protein [Fumia xinanensis]MBC8559618.1 hypothetical protein [Fumia xinanensis]
MNRIASKERYICRSFLVSGAGEPITGRRLFKHGSGVCNIISKLIENA